MRSPEWFKRLVGFVVPKPNIVFVLERPAEEIFSQKPELEVDEIKRQQQAIRRSLGRDKRTIFIDAGNGVEQTVKRVSLEIERWLREYND